MDRPRPRARRGCPGGVVNAGQQAAGGDGVGGGGEVRMPAGEGAKDLDLQRRAEVRWVKLVQSDGLFNRRCQVGCCGLHEDL